MSAASHLDPALASGVREAVVTPASAWRRLGHRMAAGARFGVAAATAVWLSDVACLAASRGAVPWRRWYEGVFSAFFVAATSAAVVGAALGPVLGPVAGELVRGMGARIRALRAGEGEARRLLAAQALAFVGQLPLWMWAVYRAALAVEFSLARPQSVALVVALLCAAYAASFAIAWPWAVRLALPLIARLEALLPSRPTPGWWLAAVVTLPPAALIAALAAHYRAELAVLPWRECLAVPAAALGCTIAASPARVPPGTGPRPAHLLWLLPAAAFSASVVCAVRLKPEATMARSIAFERAISGRLGYAAWTAAFDFDRDGQLSMLGGGDCAPFDPERYTGAVEIPGNGIDEDCDGQDLPRMAIKPRGPVPVGQSRLPQQPTIVLITVDALAAPRLSALGSPVRLMPNVDRLAAQGALFTHCFAQGPSTRLSFPSMFTSRWDSQTTQVFSPHFPYSLAPTETQLQDMLDSAAYQTIAVLPSAYFTPQRWQSVTRGFQRVDTSALPIMRNNAVQVTDAALRLLAEPSDRPRYLWVHYYDAHGPYEPIPGVSYTKRDDRSYYEAELTFIDRQIGRLLEGLDGRPEPVDVILTADHGTVFHPNPATRRAYYGYDLYTATLHVPLIVRGPGIEPRKLDGIVTTMDIAPTIAELAHLPYSPRFEGTSLMPELLTGKTDDARVLFHEFYLGERLFRGEDPLGIVSVRDARWNLVLDREHGAYELYDWEHDYYEQNNVFEDEGQDPDARHLRSLLGAFLQQFFEPSGPPVKGKSHGPGELAEHDEP